MSFHVTIFMVFIFLEVKTDVLHLEARSIAMGTMICSIIKPHFTMGIVQLYQKVVAEDVEIQIVVGKKYCEIFCSHGQELTSRMISEY